MVKLKDLKLIDNNKDIVMSFNGKEINIKSYLPIRDKYDLVMITLQKSKEDGLYNPIKIDMFFHLHLVYMYTDIEFADEDRSSEEILYDKLTNSGFMETFLSCLNEDEYDTLYSYLQTLIKDNMKYRNSAAAIIQSLIQDLPANAEAARQIVDSFDPQKYQEVIKFAEAANGGRPVPQIVRPETARKVVDALEDTDNDWK